ncbi:hypothetical protein BT96DRAFT_943457 [Gymnopus androsaceus JB14]|uniref:F-box domain-containing protein n=1 Tax=Gymnopus androsaceus JB14 TaxID=1447944 RepID=A0A6A4H8C7_9AGAR|nr:hypothetical protein BT96DRAFT_943457 [Gymnopus androsaceus JB14]
MSLIFWFETDETILIRRIATSASDKSNFSGFIFLLTWVCAWWREIILSQPSFWTSMMISSSSYLAIDNFETANSLLRECLLHAGSTMPFCFGVFLFDVQLSAPGLSDVLDALAGVASRWKEFRVMVPPELLHYMHDQIHPGILPVLECLDFAVDVDAPLDRNLKHLVTLELSVYLCSFFAVLLEKCPLLQTFSVAHCLVPENDEAPLAVRPSRPIHHTQLKSLNYRLFRIPNEMDPWESVYLPKLTCLEIEAEDVDDATVVNRLHELKALATRSKCVLDRITLDGDIPDDVVASFFQVGSMQTSSFSKRHNGFVDETISNPEPRYLER